MRSGLGRRLLHCSLLALGVGNEETHEYKQGEELHIWFDKFGPYNNPQENYPYEMSLLCELEGEGSKIEYSSTLAEALEGHNLVASNKMPLKFMEDVQDKEICSFHVTAQMKTYLEKLIAANYWYSVYVDDLPNWAFLGEHAALLAPDHLFPKAPDQQAEVPKGQLGKAVVEASASTGGIPMRNHLFTHRHFVIDVKDNNILEVNLEPGEPVEVQVGETIPLTFSVTWQQAAPEKTFENRYNRYLESKFFEHKVHWFAIVNSFILCLFLCTVVALILMKTLRRDFSKYAVDELEELESLDRADDSGWKHVHGDVFRQPSYLIPFSTLYASGVHLLCIVSVALLFAVSNTMTLYLHRGGVRWVMIVIFLLTSFANGYCGGHFYRLYAPKAWKRTMFLQLAFMPSVLCGTFSVINSVAWGYGSSHSVPFLRIIQGLFLYMVTAIPLHVLGTLAGRRSAAKHTFPARVHHLKRPIPVKHWAFLPGLVIGGGLVPFACIFVEMYFLFSAFWSYNKVYYVYSFLLAIVIVLSIILVNVSVTCTYLLLNAEDYRWHWYSFGCCASTGLYVLLYAAVYFMRSTAMTGLLQYSYYWGVSVLFAACVSLYSGALGVLGASAFVHLIYSNIKVE
jgi:transmembrane 9 superfamily protein 3